MMRRTICFLIVLSCCFWGLSCRSKEPADESLLSPKADTVKTQKAKPRRSRKAKIFLNDIDAMLQAQEDERREAEEKRRLQEQERRIQLTINQTLDELLSQNPDRDKVRVRQLIDDLHNFGGKSIEALKMLLSENRPEQERLLLTMALGSFSGDKMSGDEAEELLFSQAMEAKNEKVREQALSSLRNAGNRDALLERSVRRYKQSTSPADKKYAVAVLSSVGGDSAVYRIREILDEADDPQLRRAAIKALGGSGGDVATSVLWEVFDNDEVMRGDAAEALGKINRLSPTDKEEIVLSLGERLWDEESSGGVKLAAVRGLGADNGGLARGTLLRVLKDAKQPREVHQAAISALLVGAKMAANTELIDYMQIFKATPVEYLPQMLQPLLAVGGMAIVQDLRAVFPKLNQLKKIHAVRTMARVGEEEVFDIYQSILGQEKDAAVRREILSDIARDRWKKHAPRIVAIYLSVIDQAQDKNERLTALRNLQKVSPTDAVSIAEKNLHKGEDVDLCRASIEILRRHGTNRSRDALLAFGYTDAAKGLEKQIDKALEAIDSR